VCLPPEETYTYATKAIAARRAALIADAHVGLPFNGGDSGDWYCHCMVGEYGGRRYKANHDDIQYCEPCHTRRPDAVQREVPKQKFENDAGKSCRNCKHKLRHWENEPCKSCDFSDNWEVHK
jgi:hypothetical protein